MVCGRTSRHAYGGDMRNQTRELFPLAELGRVLARVGCELSDRLEWAIRFARVDLDSLTTAEWLTTRSELLVFSSMPTGLAGDRDTSPDARQGTERPPESVVLPTIEDTRAAQSAFHSLIERFIMHGDATIGPVNVICRLVRG